MMGARRTDRSDDARTGWRSSYHRVVSGLLFSSELLIERRGFRGARDANRRAATVVLWPFRSRLRNRSLDNLVDDFEKATGGAWIPTDCLAESVVLAEILRVAQIGHELRLGVRTTTGRLEAHAWVEVEGVPVRKRDANAMNEYAPMHEDFRLR